MLSENKEYRITSLAFKDTQSNTKMAKLQLKCDNEAEVLNCVIWQDILEKLPKQTLKVGNIIKIKKHDHNESYNNYILQSIELVKEEKIGLSEQEKEDLLGKIYEAIESLSDAKLKKALLQVIVENEKLYISSPAAERIHHNYIGGLLQHTWECINIANALWDTLYKNVDRELIIAGCIAHDFGKMFEYSLDEETGAIGRNEKFERVWINHIHWGFSWANQNEFPALAHLIASHHGLKEWKALVEPQTCEAQLLHLIDTISARAGATEINDLERKQQGQLRLI